MRLASTLFTASAALATATSAFGIGATECASADGKLRRVEQEIWGANPVTWSYDGETLPSDKVKVDPDGTFVVNDFVRSHPDMGIERTMVTVERVTVTLQDGRQIQENALCRLLEYPDVLD